LQRRYGDDLLDVLEKHPDVPFGRLPRGSDARQWVGPANRANEECLDNWGCLWHCVRDGMEGQIKYHPLSAFNMQVNCVGVDVIENRLKGRMCIIADVDRQSVVPFGKPEEAYNHIAEIITRLGSPRGGLILRVDIYPDVPLENIDAVMSAISDYQNHWVNKG
jgi:hypothetical protein